MLAALMRSRGGQQPSAPGQGNQADALTRLKNAVELIESSLGGLDKGSRPYQAAIDSLRRLTRFLPQGAGAMGVQQTDLLNIMRGLMRNAMLQQIIQNRGGAQAAPGAADQGAGPAGPDEASAPMPSTPLPGS
jgi:hypothetical protein